MKTLLSKLILIGILGLAFVISTQAARAEVVFPVGELGNCADKTACRAYCDIAANFQACTEFAEKNNLLSREAIERSKKFISLLKAGGPGNCKTERMCRTYCEDVSHLQACTRAAKNSGIVSAQEAARLEKITALKEQDLPGDCTSIATCRTYCADPAHKEECLAFAESAGYFPREEVNRAKQQLLRDPVKVLPARPRFSAAIMRCIEQSAGKSAAERIHTGALQMDSKMEMTVKECVRRAEAAKPTISPTRPVKPAEDVPVISVIPPELLNGGATNLPVPETRLRTSIKRHFYLGSLLRGLFSF